MEILLIEREENKTLIFKILFLKDMLTAKVERDKLPTMDGQTLSCVLIENLTPATVYLFCVVAINRMGRSLRSDHAQCVTLDPGECLITGNLEEN